MTSVQPNRPNVIRKFNYEKLAYTGASSEHWQRRYIRSSQYYKDTERATACSIGHNRTTVFDTFILLGIGIYWHSAKFLPIPNITYIKRGS